MKKTVCKVAAVGLSLFLLCVGVPLAQAEDGGPMDDTAQAEDEGDEPAEDEGGVNPDTGVPIWPETRAEVPAYKPALNRSVTITFKKKSKKDKPEVLKGKLIAVYQEMVPAYAAKQETWLVMQDLNVAVKGNEQIVPWKNVKKITFDNKYDMQNKGNDKKDAYNTVKLISCTIDMEESPNRRECLFPQRFQAVFNTSRARNVKGNIVNKKRIMMVVKDKKGKIHEVTFYPANGSIDNRKNESQNEKPLSELLIKEYFKAPASIVFH